MGDARDHLVCNYYSGVEFGASGPVIEQKLRHREIERDTESGCGTAAPTDVSPEGSI